MNKVKILVCTLANEYFFIKENLREFNYDIIGNDFPLSSANFLVW